MSHVGKAGPPYNRGFYCVVIHNLPYETTPHRLKTLFRPYGKVLAVYMPKGYCSEDSRGFAFVRYEYKEDAKKAIEALDGSWVAGNRIDVEYEKQTQDQPMTYDDRFERDCHDESDRARSHGHYRHRSPSPRSSSNPGPRRSHRGSSRSRSHEHHRLRSPIPHPSGSRRRRSPTLRPTRTRNRRSPTPQPAQLHSQQFKLQYQSEFRPLYERHYTMP